MTQKSGLTHCLGKRVSSKSCVQCIYDAHPPPSLSPWIPGIPALVTCHDNGVFGPHTTKNTANSAFIKSETLRRSVNLTSAGFYVRLLFNGFGTQDEEQGVPRGPSDRACPFLDSFGEICRISSPLEIKIRTRCLPSLSSGSTFSVVFINSCSDSFTQLVSVGHVTDLNMHWYCNKCDTYIVALQEILHY